MTDSQKKLPLVEVFGPTIQGEGIVIGQQTYFMRFGLCDYKCKMCDSMNAVDPQQVKANARWLTQEEIIADFLENVYKQNSAKWVTLSGGNPCIHDLSILVSVLKKLKFQIAVETQGTFSPSWLSQCDVITVSPKGPGMGETTYYNQLDKFMAYVCSACPEHVNMKIVIFDQRDLEFAKQVHERYAHTGVPFYLSLGNPYPPGVSTDGSIWTPENHAEHMCSLIGQYKSLWNDISCDPILSKMRWLPQWHVFVWGNQKGK